MSAMPASTSVETGGVPTTPGAEPSRILLALMLLLDVGSVTTQREFPEPEKVVTNSTLVLSILLATVFFKIGAADKFESFGLLFADNAPNCMLVVTIPFWTQ